MASSVTILGVLENSAGGVMTRGDAWSLVVHLMPWTIQGAVGASPTKPLRIEIPIGNRSKLDRWTAKLDRGCAVRVVVNRVRTIKNPRTHVVLPWLLAKATKPPRIITMPTSVALAAADLAQPVRVTDKTLGKLVWARHKPYYEGKSRLWNAKVLIFIQPSPTEKNLKRPNDTRVRERDANLHRAVQRFRALASKRTTIGQGIARKILPLYNKTWRDERPVLTAQGLLRKLKLTEVVIEQTSTTLFASIGQLFHGHAIMISLDRLGKLTDVDLAG